MSSYLVRIVEGHVAIRDHMCISMVNVVGTMYVFSEYEDKKTVDTYL